jgi:hypothetical protein
VWHVPQMNSSNAKNACFHPRLADLFDALGSYQRPPLIR